MRRNLPTRNNDLVVPGVGAGTVPANADPSPTPVERRGDEPLSTDELRALVMNYDIPSDDRRPAAPVIRDVKPANVSPPPPPPPVAPASVVPAVPQGNPEVTQLTGLVRELLQAQHGGAAKPAADGETPLPFNVQLPAQFLEAIRSDDSAIALRAITNLLNTGANMAVLHVQKEFREQVMPTLRNLWLADVQQVVTNMEARRNFYMAYPHLDNAACRVMVERVTEALLLDYKNKGVQVDGRSQAFLKEVGDQTTNLIKSMGGDNGAPGGSGNNPGDNGARAPNNQSNGQPFKANPGTRPPARNGRDKSDEIEDVIS